MSKVTKPIAGVKHIKYSHYSPCQWEEINEIIEQFERIKKIRIKSLSK